MVTLILCLLFVVLVCSGLLIFAQLRPRSRKMTLLTCASVFGLCFSVWCYKDFERQYERHFLLRDFGHVIVSIDELAAINHYKGIQQAFKFTKVDEWKFHPERQQISILSQSLNDALNNKPFSHDIRSEQPR
ncbi:MAG: hypothetical protein J0L73_11880 [Verrucomicrobia bacterium]|nr:hypothetical protein [Verrucomicrobiota bacterium]